MAVTKKTEAASAPAKSKSTAVAKKDEFDDLSALAGAGKALEDAERAKTGSSLTWITCVQPGAGVTTKGDPAYIKGVEAGSFYIADRQLALGEKLRGTVIGMFKVYGEIKKKEKESEMAKTISFWLPEDAEQIPVEGNFERPLSNGNILVPMHWVFLEIEGHEDIVDAMLAFRSKGNSYYTAFNKLVKKSSEICAQLVVEFDTEAVPMPEYKKTYFYPVGQVVGKNFDYDSEAGKVTLIKGGASAGRVREILEKYARIQKEFADLKVVSKRNAETLKTLLPGGGGAARKGLPAGTGAGGYASEGDEGHTEF